MRRIYWVLMVTLLTTVTPMLAQQAGSANADEKAIRAEAAAWSKAMEAKDAAKFVEFYAADARVLPPNAPAVNGKAARLEYWKKFMATPGLKGSFGPDKVVVAKSGDLAYEMGTYSLVMNDAKGNPEHETGKYLVVWKKQADGKWKVVADMFSSDK